MKPDFTEICLYKKTAFVENTAQSTENYLNYRVFVETG
jgi:hypothetical protein